MKVEVSIVKIMAQIRLRVFTVSLDRFGALKYLIRLAGVIVGTFGQALVFRDQRRNRKKKSMCPGRRISAELT